MKHKNVYLDYAAATPQDPRVTAVMEKYFSQNFFNPSSLYDQARKVRRELEDHRQSVAEVLGAKKSEIIFTAGGTESINLALLGCLRSIPQGGLLISPIEHDAVMAVAEQAKKEGHPVKELSLSPGGLVDEKLLGQAVNDETVLVSVMYANNETGTIQPIAKLAKVLAEARADRISRGITLPIYLHTDASQAAGRLDLHVNRLGVDMMTLNGGKIYGPKQSGVLYVRTGVKLEPVIHGGGQERGLRGGTESVAAAAGFAQALALASEEREGENARLEKLRNQLWDDILQAFPEASINGHQTKRLPSHLNFCLPGINGEDAVLHLDRSGIQLSTGSACSTGDSDPSHVLLALGLTPEEASSSLRMTLGRYTTSEDIDYAANIIPETLKNLRMLK